MSWRRIASATAAVGHSILVSAYWMLSRGLPYEELGEDWLLTRNRERQLLVCSLAVLSVFSNGLAPSASAQAAAHVTVGVGSSSSGSVQFSMHAFDEYPQTGTAYLAWAGAVREIQLSCVIVEPAGGTTATFASGRDDIGQTWYLAVWDFGPTSTAVAGDRWSFGQSAGSEPCGYSIYGSQTHYGEFQTHIDPTLLVGDAYAAAKDQAPLPEPAAHVTTGSGSSGAGDAQFSIHAFSEYPQTGTAYLALGGAIRQIDLSCVVVQPAGGTTATYASGRDDIGQTWHMAVWDFGPTSPAIAGDRWSFGQAAGAEPCGYNFQAEAHYGEFQTAADPTLLAGDVYAAATLEESPDAPAECPATVSAPEITNMIGPLSDSGEGDGAWSQEVCRPGVSTSTRDYEDSLGQGGGIKYFRGPCPQIVSGPGAWDIVETYLNQFGCPVAMRRGSAQNDFGLHHIETHHPDLTWGTFTRNLTAHAIGGNQRRPAGGSSWWFCHNYTLRDGRERTWRVLVEQRHVGDYGPLGIITAFWRTGHNQC